MILDHVYLRHSTEMIDDVPPVLPSLYDWLFSILVPIPPPLYKDQWCSSSSIPLFDRLFLIPTPTPPPLYKDRWCSSSSTPAMRSIVFNSSNYSTSFVQRLMMLQQFHPRHATDCFQFQFLFHLLCTKIGDPPAAPPVMWSGWLVIVQQLQRDATDFR